MLRQNARKIFDNALLQIDARIAVERAVRYEPAGLFINDQRIEYDIKTSIYVVAIGKAAYPMAVGFENIAGDLVKAGVLSGVVGDHGGELPSSKWQIFEGGHPLPNEASFDSAGACFDLLEEANTSGGLVVFLISGGGSAMVDLPSNEEISLSDLRILNQTLVTSNATIAEINSIRRAVSLVKGGGLAKLAPKAKQISLIISDTADGDISSVASGPSLFPAEDIPDAMSVVEKYDLRSDLPSSIIRVLDQKHTKNASAADQTGAYVLLDNKVMVRTAAGIAGEMGFEVRIDDGAEDVPIDEGCKHLISEFVRFRRSTQDGRPVCFISGGEFSCKVNGDGFGGRNSETVLRLALLAKEERALSKYTFLSAGTDGIDGRSPAAGAVANETSIKRAMAKGLDPEDYLNRSDSYTFFDKIGDAIVTGATGTNVRDLRILISE